MELRQFSHPASCGEKAVLEVSDVFLCRCWKESLQTTIVSIHRQPPVTHEHEPAKNATMKKLESWKAAVPNEKEIHEEEEFFCMSSKRIMLLIYFVFMRS